MRASQNLILAEKHWKSAQNLVFTVYPVVRDLKLLANALQRLSDALESAIGRQNVYKQAQIQGLPKPYREMAERIATLASYHRKSLLEFKRNNRLVLYMDNDKTEEFSLEDIQDWVGRTRNLIDLLKLRKNAD